MSFHDEKTLEKKNWCFPDKLEIFFRKTKKWTKCHLRVNSKWRFSILKICDKNNRSAIFTRKRYFVQFWTFLEITKKSNFWPFSKYGVKISTIPKISKLIFFMHQIDFSKKKWWAFPVNGFKFLKFSFWLRWRFHGNQGGRQLNFSRVLKRPHIWLSRYNIKFYIEFFYSK